MTDPLRTETVDALTPPAMGAWLRETAANTRLHSQRPMLTAKEMNVAPHVAFRLEQAAESLTRHHDLVVELARYFTSGNNVPVERAAISRQSDLFIILEELLPNWDWTTGSSRTR